ncbi:MAG: ABC transporter substrate-binding protein [Oscillospiraceae bacterium]|nr:ABC transporter substrate-binding protein [Oscillospiraceae bacterium]MBQ8918105.1 ABC transporter substrate-binding protein [Oscillospiraceae bacterium]
MKRVFAILLCVAMMLSMVACGGNTAAPEADAPAAEGDKIVKIGVFEPQTGDNGAGGKQEILGMQYAHSLFPTVEIGGETYNVQLEIVDNRTSAENGPSAAAELINRDVSIVLGSYGSGVSIAGGEVFAEAGMPALGTSCTNPQVTADCEVYFRLAFLDPFQGTVLANYAFNELGIDTAYTLAMLGSDYDQGLVFYFKEAFEALGGTVISEDFPEGTANFVSYVTNAKSNNAGVIFAPVSINYAQLIVEAAASQGYEGALLGSDTWDNNKVIEAATGTDIEAFVTTFYQEGGAPEFDTGIKEWLNANPDMLTNNGGNDMIAAVTAIGYDAYLTALEALKLAGSTDRAAVLEAMPNVSFEGVTGLIEFDEIGDAKRDGAFIKTANTVDGVWDFVKVQTVE